MTFFPIGVADWFIHYSPKAGSSERIIYTFEDGNENLTLIVDFLFEGQGIERVEDALQSRKIVREGQVVILRADKAYTPQGQQIINH